MAKSWELTNDQKKEIQERQREIGAEYDPETGKKKGEVENVDNTGDDEDVEGLDNGRNREIDNDNIR